MAKIVEPVDSRDYIGILRGDFDIGRVSEELPVARTGNTRREGRFCLNHRRGGGQLARTRAGDAESLSGKPVFNRGNLRGSAAIARVKFRWLQPVVIF